MGEMIVKTQIEGIFESEKNNLTRIRERFTAQVVRWVYSTREIWSWEENRKKGTDDALLPDSRGALFACGFDRADQPIVLYHFDYETVFEPSQRCIPSTTIWCEEFISHNDGNIELFRFVRGQLERVARLRFQGSKELEEESVVQGVFRHFLTHYKGSKRQLEQSLNSSGQVFFEVSYGPHGEQTFFRVRRDGTRVELGRPLPQGVTVQTLKKVVIQRLVENVPVLVSSAPIDEPICCVALAYDDEGNDALPPLIGIGVESERQRFRALHGKRAKMIVWNPAEFLHFEKSYTQLSDDALEEACDYLNGKWAEAGSSSPASRLLEDIAVQLTRMKWPATVRRTRDFVVYAISLQGRGLRRSLKASLTPGKWAKLKADGLI